MSIFEPVKKLMTVLVGGAEVDSTNRFPTEDAATLAAIEAQAKGTSADPTVTTLSGSTPLDDESVLVTAGAVTELSVPEGARRAVAEVQEATIRYRLAGGDPTASSGHRARAGDVIHLDHVDEVSNFRAYAEDGDATLFVTYY